MDTQQRLQLFKNFYSDLKSAEWGELSKVYARDVNFADPVHKLEGLPALDRYLQALCKDVTQCRFVYLDEAIDGDTAYIKWNMLFAHPKVASNKLITLRGVSQLEINVEGIFFQEDFYDLGAMLYEHVPMVGGIIRWLKNGLAS